jgi:hypothetical protein
VTYPKIYNCIPELSKLINPESDNYNFDIRNIYENLSCKNICFINFVNINNGLDILTNQIKYIKGCGLYDKLDYIFIIALGKQTKLPFLDYKIKMIHDSKGNIKESLALEIWTNGSISPRRSLQESLKILKKIQYQKMKKNK